MNGTIIKFAAASLTLAWLAGQTIGSGDLASKKGTKIDTIGNVTVYQSGESKETITLYWRGEISHDMGKHMVAALKKHRRKTDRFIIDISSPGGYVKSGEVLIDYMKKLKPDYTIETRVPNKGKCLSMCVPIFLNGEQRYAGSSTVFMFHRPWVEEEKFGSSVKEQAAQRRYKARLNSKLSQEAWRFFNVHFNYSPIDPKWLKNLQQQWKTKGKDYWTDGEKLVREKSNVITHLL